MASKVVSDGGGGGDFDKLLKAFETLKFSSVDELLGHIGLADLPTAQRYGILFGILTFICTVTAVVILLTLGGSWGRIAEQAKDGGSTVKDAVTVREGRPLLLEFLLDARERMMRNNYADRYEGKKAKDGQYSALTRMLLNVAPSREVTSDVTALMDDTNKKEPGLLAKVFGSSKQNSATMSSGGSGNGQSKNNKPKPSRDDVRDKIPEGYEENYVHAYRRCQDKPGGNTLSGLPEARFEAYARAYAGCGTHTKTSYRRSYARMYEAVACKSHATEKEMSEHFESRPWDLVGRTVKLEPLEEGRHRDDVFEITSGEACGEDRSYNPAELWAFREYGPFKSPSEMASSPIFRLREGEAAFAIIEQTTDRVLGVVHLLNDDPKNLSIELDLPLVRPTSRGTAEEIEACFMLLDRLFALGYRRVTVTVDSQDGQGRRLPGRMGFTQEGIIPKHRIVKDANRDSIQYGMLNTDWDKGARAFLFGKLHGPKAAKADEMNNAKEGELEHQTKVLREKEEEAKRKKEEAEKTEGTTKDKKNV